MLLSGYQHREDKVFQLRGCGRDCNTTGGQDFPFRRQERISRALCVLSAAK